MIGSGIPLTCQYVNWHHVTQLLCRVVFIYPVIDHSIFPLSLYVCVLAYPAMSFWLNKTGRPILFSCSWPAYQEGHMKVSFYIMQLVYHCLSPVLLFFCMHCAVSFSRYRSHLLTYLFTYLKTLFCQICFCITIFLFVFSICIF